jgi:transposase InsO family protein
MPWKEMDPMSMKLEFVLKAVSGREAMSDLCAQYGISRKTGYKWRERFMARGMAGLSERSRRPGSSPRGLDEDSVCRIIELKLAHPHWGARKLMEIWRRSYAEGLPSESSFKRVLSKAGLVHKRRRRHRSLEAGRLQLRREASAPNQVWTVDFKGWWSARDGRCEPLTVRDAFSRYVLLAAPLASTRGEAVRQAFEALFERYGLPESIRSDNGSPFASASAPLGLTRLSAWWVALGINLDRIDPGRPDQNGAHERVHRDIALEVQSLAGASLHKTTQVLESWRRSYNEERPHEALGMKCPAELYESSARKWQGTPEDLDYPAGYIPRRVNTRHGNVKIRNRSVFITTAVGGWSVGLKPLSPSELSVHFGPLELGRMNLRTESFAPARAGANDPTPNAQGAPNAMNVSPMS